MNQTEQISACIEQILWGINPKGAELLKIFAHNKINYCYIDTKHGVAKIESGYSSSNAHEYIINIHRNKESYSFRLSCDIQMSELFTWLNDIDYQ